MRIVNREKERVRNYLKNDLTSNLTNIHHEKQELRQILSLIAQIMEGSQSGIHRELMAGVEQAMSQLSMAEEYLYAAGDAARSLDVTEEVPDEQY